MTWALVALAALLASMLVPTGVWLHAEISEGKNLRDRLDQEQQASMEYRHQRDEATARLKVTEDQLETEHDLRLVAETQRNEAKRKLSAYLARSLATASEEEIKDVIDDVFATPLSLVPGNELMRPGE